MKQDVTDYVIYYNVDRLHSANHELSPIEFENSLKSVLLDLASTIITLVMLFIKKETITETNPNAIKPKQYANDSCGFCNWIYDW